MSRYVGENYKPMKLHNGGKVKHSGASSGKPVSGGVRAGGIRRMAGNNNKGGK